MEALSREALEKIQPFGNSKRLQKTPKLTPMGAVANREEIRRNTLSKTPSKNPTGPGEDMELPKYFLKLHETAPAKS